MRPAAAVIDDRRDGLGAGVARRLVARGHAVLHLPAAALAKAEVEVDSARASVNGQRLGAVLLRTQLPGWFAEGFRTEDAAFCHAEASAAWMAVLDLECVLAINRLDPQLWFTHAEWAYWRQRLEEADVPVPPVRVGDGASACWLPWTGGVARIRGQAASRCLASASTAQPPSAVGVWVGGRHVAGQRCAAGAAAARVMAEHGAIFGQVATAKDGSVVLCTAHPTLADERITTALAEALDAHLHRR